MSGKTLQGDLLALAEDGAFDVIVHGCNCFCTMGAGIAKAISTRHPAALAADRATLKGDCAKLGTFSFAEVPGASGPFVIVNAYTQFHWRGTRRKADYDAISQAFAEIAAQFPAARIGYPMIGAGLAGGDWAEIGPRINAALAGHDHTLVVFAPTW